MGLILNYLGAGAALVVSAFVYLFSSIPIPSAPPPEPVIPIATLEAVGSGEPLDTLIESLLPTPTIIEALEESPLLSPTSTPRITPPVPSITPPAPVERPAPQPPVTVPSTPAPTPTPAPPPAPQPLATTPEPAPAPAADTPMAKLAAASVNIVCSGNGSNVRGMSGSGVIISPNGVIMTVAHVAQYYLLFDYPAPGSISCTVRTGSPARATYIARPLYVSEEWIKENPATLMTLAPKGSGEGDYAFLEIVGSVNGSTPSSFPYMPLSTSEPKKGDTAYIAAYPAQTLSSSEIRMSLARTEAVSSVTDRFTFDTNQVDVVSLAGNTAAQTGSSGAGVAGKDSRVFGMITTSSTEGPYASRRLHAITATYIRRSFEEQTGRSLDSFLKNPTSLSSELSSLADLLTETLSN